MQKPVAIATTIAAVILVFLGSGLYYDHARPAPESSSTETSTTGADYHGPPLAPVVWPADSPLFVTFLGDSLTASYNASAPEFGYKNILLDKLAKYGPVAESGVAIPGGRLQRVAEIAPEVGPANRLVIIELGTDDAADPTTPIEEFTSQYRNLLAETRMTAPDAPLICLGTWLGVNEEGASTGQDFDSVIRAECLAQDGIYLRLDSLFGPDNNRGPAGRPAIGDRGISDNFHPNNAGHAQIAKQILGRLDLPDQAIN